MKTNLGFGLFFTLPNVAAFLFARPLLAQSAAQSTSNAAQSMTNAPTPPPALPIALSDSPMMTFSQVAMALLLVLLCIWFVAWLARRFLQTGGGLGMPARARVISAISLGGRERLVIVEIGESWLVLGVSAGGVSHLQTLPKPEQSEAAADLVFAERLKSFLNTRQKPKQKAEH